MAVTRADIERLVWRLSGWRVEQPGVDTLMAAVDEHVAGTSTVVREGIWVSGCGEDGHVPCCAPLTPEPPPVAVPAISPEDLLQQLSAAHAAGREAAIAERSVRPSEDMIPSSEGLMPGVSVRDGHGGVWLFVGTPVQAAPSTSEERIKGGTHTVCKVCGGVKTVNNFRKDKEMRTGVRSTCKPCENKVSRAKRAEARAS